MKLFGTKKNASHLANVRGKARKQDIEPAYEEPRRLKPEPAPVVREPREPVPAREENRLHEAAVMVAAAQAVEAEYDAYDSPPPRRGRRLRRVLVGLLIVAILATGGVYALMMLYVRPPELAPWTPTERPGVNADLADLEQEIAPVDREVFTVLIAGQDNVGSVGLTDTLMLASIDPGNGEVNVVSIPRDTMVDVNWTGRKINSVFPMTGSIDRLMEEVERITGFMPDFYVTIYLDGFEALVDTIGPIEFNVPIRMQYSDPYDSPPLHIDLAAGYQMLNGDQAMQVVRYRRSIGDFGRMENQQNLLRAIAGELLQVSTVPRIPELAGIFLNHVETDLPLGTMVWLAQQLMGMDSEDINFRTMEVTDAWVGGVSYQVLDLEAWLELVNTYLNPFPVPITEEHVQAFTWRDGSVQLVGEGFTLTPQDHVPPVENS